MGSPAHLIPNVANQFRVYQWFICWATPITVASPAHRGVSYRRQHDRLLKYYSGLQHMKFQQSWSSVRKSSVISGFPSQRTNNSESVLMSSRNDADKEMTMQEPCRSGLTFEGLMVDLVVWLDALKTNITYRLWLAVVLTCKCKIGTNLA